MAVIKLSSRHMMRALTVYSFASRLKLQSLTTETYHNTTPKENHETTANRFQAAAVPE